MDNYLNIGVKGQTIWPKEETKITFDTQELILKPVTKKTEQSIHINLCDISDIEALSLINRFLSVLSWCDDQGLENIYGWSGNPKPVAVPLQIKPTSSSIAFPFHRDIEQDPKAQLALALFREGLTLNSIPFSFLSYFKVLNIFWKDKYENGSHEMIEGIRNTLDLLTEDQAKKRIEELKETEKDPAQYLYKSGRCAVAHSYQEPIVDPDNMVHLRRLSEDILVIKNIAEYLIENKLNVSRSLY